MYCMHVYFSPCKYVRTSSTFLLEDRAFIYCQVLLCVFVYVVTMPIHVHTLLYANCTVLYIHVHICMRTAHYYSDVLCMCIKLEVG